MNGFNQIVPISQLPRRYDELIKEADSTNQPIIIFRRNKPVAGLVDFSLLEKLLAAQREQELRLAFCAIKEGEEAYQLKKTKVLKKVSDLWKINHPWKKSQN
ncbi:MAG: hypothetical protein UV05_C0015G0006 [candidate division CPR1 bacterium GW2011_GWA2_42_17]|uniref:Antitoxin n=1 Tax=candidate division CPR1 bacterium GW2011_GWA2_42_17 TaxID=1618341 RepID=A0A0G0Z5J1_9BACT|nr:MAG: hypothetical protein UV05_C0015G0006 [candidate division CPR1 bacterium GW2011_GWA2_42_17]